MISSDFHAELIRVLTSHDYGRETIMSMVSIRQVSKKYKYTSHVECACPNPWTRQPMFQIAYTIATLLAKQILSVFVRKILTIKQFNFHFHFPKHAIVCRKLATSHLLCQQCQTIGNNKIHNTNPAHSFLFTSCFSY